MGLVLLPIMLSLGKALVKLADLTRPVTSRAWALKIVIGALVASLVTLKIVTVAQAAAEAEITMATRAWTAAMWLLDLAMDANPIMIVTLAIIALGVGLYVAYKKVGWFHNAIDAMFSAIVVGARFAFTWLRKNWPLLLGILTGPFGLAAVLIVEHIGQIKRFVLNLVDVIKGAFAALLSYLRHLPSKLAGGATGVLKGAVKSIPGAGFLAGKLATGGVAGMTGTYLVGERGPEFVQLPRGAGVAPVVSQAAGKGAAGSPLVIEVPVYIEAREIARATARVTADQLARR